MENLKFAGVGKRVSAFIIDFVLVWTAILIWTQLARAIFDSLNLPFYPRFTFMSAYDAQQWNFFLVFIAEMYFWYTLIFLTSMLILQQTLGQKTIGIRWVSSDSKDPATRQILERWLIGILKITLVVFPGPAFAKIFPAMDSWSMFFLMAALLFLIIEPLISSRKMKRSLSEKYSELYLVMKN